MCLLQLEVFDFHIELSHQTLEHYLNIGILHWIALSFSEHPKCTFSMAVYCLAENPAYLQEKKFA